jgi:hypothetical protein
MNTVTVEADPNRPTLFDALPQRRRRMGQMTAIDPQAKPDFRGWGGSWRRLCLLTGMMLSVEDFAFAPGWDKTSGAILGAFFYTATIWYAGQGLWRLNR